MPSRGHSDQARQVSCNIDTGSLERLEPRLDGSVCSHLDTIRPVFPSARDCEECLRAGDRWVHLRI